MKATFTIRRYQPEVRDDPYYEDFEIEIDPTDRVLDGLNEIRWHHDGTLALRRSCQHGICGSDAMRIAGRNRLAELDRRDGVWACRTVFNCTKACPVDIQVTKAIGEVKRAIVEGGA